MILGNSFAVKTLLLVIISSKAAHIKRLDGLQAAMQYFIVKSYQQKK